MFCPRCGRPVSPTANFCGGCGLPKSEIEKAAVPQVQPDNNDIQLTENDISELNGTLYQLESDLTGTNPIENYTIDTTVITNTDAEQSGNIDLEIKTDTENQSEEQKNDIYGQSDYSRNAPQHPLYTQTGQQQRNTQSVNTAYQPVTAGDQNLSTVDFVWMLLISSIPVMGLFYVIYQAFVQKENVNKQSWAKATMIVYLFAFLLALVFSLGLALTSFIYW